MRIIPCQSSNLSAVAWRPGTKDIYVQFVTGKWYVYETREPLEAAHIVASILFDEVSQGKAFNSLLKNTFPVAAVMPEEVEDMDFHV